MSEEPNAWVWIQFQGVATDQNNGSPAKGVQESMEENVERLKPRLGSVHDRRQEKNSPDRTKYGYVIAAAVLAGLFFPMLAMILLVIAALLIYSGKEPKKTREFFDGIPAGAYANKALDYIDSFLK
jgi:hypothetical protein